MGGMEIVIVLVAVLGVVIAFCALTMQQQNSRTCPSCNHRVPQFDPVCRVCGFDFRIISNDQFGR